MRKKLLIIGTAILVAAAIIFAIYPEIRTFAKKAYYSGARTAAQTYDSAVDSSRKAYQTLASATKKEYQRAKNQIQDVVSTASIPDDCIFKEFSDLTPDTEDHGWAYWYMHAAKQNNILSTSASCLDDPFKAGPGKKVAIWDYECYKNRAQGNSYCPARDPHEDPYYDRLSQREVRDGLEEDLGMAIEVPSDYQGWGTSACICDDQNTTAESLDECDYNYERGHIVNPLYKGDCITKAQLMSLISYNLNQEIAIRISGELTVQDNIKPVADLDGATIILEGKNQEGLWYQIATTEAYYSSLTGKTTYELILTNPIRQAMDSVINKEFEVTAKKEGFWSYGNKFTLDSINIKENFDLKILGEYEFRDVTPDDWAYWYIASVSQNEIIPGSDERFYPTITMDRAGAAVSLGRAAGLGPCYSCSQTFNDVPPGHWAFGYIETLARLGFMDGFDDGSFRPASDATQGQFATAISNATERPTIIPPGYQPEYNPSAEILRAQAASFLSWNFNTDLTLEVDGGINYVSGEDASSLDGVKVKLFREDGAYMGEQTTAYYNEAEGRAIYELQITRPIQAALNSFITGEPYFIPRVYKDDLQLEQSSYELLAFRYTNQYYNISIKSIPFTLTGKLTVFADLVPVSNLDGAVVKLYFEDGRYIAQTTAHYDPSTNETRYTLTYNNLDALWRQLVVLHVYKEDFDDHGGEYFTINYADMGWDYEVEYNRIVIKGSVVSLCGADHDKKNLVGITVKLFDNSDPSSPVLLDTTQTGLSEGEEFIQFTFIVDRFSEDRDFKIKVIKPGYFTATRNITVSSDAVIDHVPPLMIKANKTDIKGRIIFRKKDGQANWISENRQYEVILRMNGRDYPSIKTDQTGEFLINDLDLPKDIISAFIEVKPAGLLGRFSEQKIYFLTIFHCPQNNIEDIIHEGDSECKIVTDSGISIKFCAWGEDVIEDLNNDEDFNARLNKIVEYIAGIRVEVDDDNILNPDPQIFYPKGVVNIVSLGWGGGYSIAGKNSITLSYQKVKIQDLLYVKDTTIHEFGHLYEFRHTAKNDTLKENWWQVHSAGKKQKNNDSEIWRRLDSPDFNTDYPGTSRTELFVESFVTRYLYKDRYREYTVDTEIPTQSRSFYRFTWDLHGVDWAGDLIKASTDVATRIYEQISQVLSY